MIFVFWELVGFSSYLLIAHYFQTDEASPGFQKSIHRQSDWRFRFSIRYYFDILDFWYSKSSGIICHCRPRPWYDINFPVFALLACGFIGKSAQFPLHVWLPDAMAGPTPVSALIHAATMVAAGIFLLIRIDFLFTPEALQLIGLMGSVMGLYAGFCALTQGDIENLSILNTFTTWLHGRSFRFGYTVSLFSFDDACFF